MILGNVDGNDGEIQNLGLNGQTDTLIAIDRKLQHLMLLVCQQAIWRFCGASITWLEWRTPETKLEQT